MNDVADPKAVKAHATITSEDRARRREAVDDGRGSVRLEGLVVSPCPQELNRRYSEDEITSEQLTAAILAIPHP